MIVNLDQAIKIVKSGGIVIFPTDTAFGIGCRIDDPSSVRNLFVLRKRDPSKAVPVLFSSIDQVKDYVLPFDSDVENLMNKYWPGALTIVLKCKVPKVPSLVRGGADTLGVRIPDNNTILDLISAVGVPIIGTSANFAGEKTPYSFEDLDKELLDMVDGVLDSTADIQVYLRREKNVSTVVDCTQNEWKILREGAIDLNEELGNKNYE